MRTKTAVPSLAVAASLCLTAGAARAQLQPPPPLPQQPAPAPMWNPFAPPPPASQPYGPYQGPSTTQQRLDQAEQEDSGRGLEIAWVNVEGGGSYANFGSGATTGGPMVGVGAGVRFFAWTLGVRARLHPYKDYSLLQIDGEAGFHIPTGSWDPYAKLRLGYGRTSDIGVAPFAASLSGLDAGLGIGVDYYLSALFSLGLEGSGDLLFFSKTGGVAGGSLHAGLHFDL